MDDQSQALNEQVETETTLPASPTEEQTAEVVDQEDATPEVETPEVPKKKGAQSRIKELNYQVHSLRDRIAELTSPVGQPGQYPQFQPQQSKPLIGPDETLDAMELERRMQEREQQILQRADQLATLRTQQISNLDRVNRESEKVVGKYSELNPESDSFDSELSDTIYEAVEAKLKAEPTASIEKFVDRQMKLYKRGVSVESEQTRATVAKQASQGAIKSSQAKPVEKTFSELSIEEMEARLGKIDF